MATTINISWGGGSDFLGFLTNTIQNSTSSNVTATEQRWTAEFATIRTASLNDLSGNPTFVTGFRATNFESEYELVEVATVTGLNVAFADFRAAALTSEAAFANVLGDVIFNGNVGRDLISLGAGNDVLHLGAGNDVARGGAGNDTLEGWSGNDLLYGDDGNDVFYGNTGNDTIYGGRGADLIFGAEDDNFIDGGAGNDTLVGGGAGSDIFVFGKNYGRDKITGFDAVGVEHDTIDLTKLRGINSFADVKRLMQDRGDDVWIRANQRDILVLEDVDRRDLGKADFDW